MRSRSGTDARNGDASLTAVLAFPQKAVRHSSPRATPKLLPNESIAESDEEYPEVSRGGFIESLERTV